MRITVIASARAEHQLTHQAVLAQGLETLGINSFLCNSIDEVQDNYVACWGWRVGKQLRERGHNVLVMERGYLGDRFKYTSLGWNGLNGYAKFPETPEDDSRLIGLGIEIKPWKKSGEYGLILGQVPGDQSLQGQNLMPWYRQVASEINVFHEIPAHFRPHPDLTVRGQTQTVLGAIRSQGSLEEALSGALFTVCYNSNSSVDSVLNGIPSVVADKGSMAYEICGHSVDDLVYPENRYEWASKLAWAQWRVDEIQSGRALKFVMDSML